MFDSQRGPCVRILIAAAASIALIVGSQTTVLASNTLGVHWPQNPGGGYPRWEPYHDHTNPSIYSNVFNHTFALYYNASNNWYPYQVCNTCFNVIDGVNAYYNDPGFIGAAQITYNSGTGHISFVTIKLDDADLAGRTYDEQHAVTCQEQGHAGGLDHVFSPTSTSCMRYGGYGWPPTDFTQHDTDTIWSIHQHTD